MLYSNTRKLILSGWLKAHNNHAYCTSLKLQKFLFFYEAFSKAENDSPDFDHLRGYKRGPVFSNVWGDYTKDRCEFDMTVDEAYTKTPQLVNEERAKKVAFIVDSLSENELSELTHKFNIWAIQAERILSGEQQVDLSEQDFGSHDISFVEVLDRMYSLPMVNDSAIISIENKYFVFTKSDSKKLTEQHYDTLSILADDEELHNPVFVTLDSEGRLLVD